jgi:hypothetical protein
LTADPLPAEDHESPSDPAEQVELVCQTLQKLAQVRQMVEKLPELPIGSRKDLLCQLACTTDNLRSLYFLDAIY